jgi:hypothetical protein
VQRDLKEFERRDARVVAVGMGTGAEADAMRRRLGLDFPLLGDPDHDAYAALDLRRDGWWSLLGKPLLERPRSALRDIADADFKAAASPRSDVQRLGGALVLDAEGRLRYLHRAKRSDDIPSNAALFAVLDSL